MQHDLKLNVHAVPGAKRTEPVGAYDDALRVRLAAPPVDGKANAELIRWAADALGVPQRAVRLVRGTTARRKQLEISFANASALAAGRAQVARWLQ